jgi:hypothetical protein
LAIGHFDDGQAFELCFRHHALTNGYLSWDEERAKLPRPGPWTIVEMDLGDTIHAARLGNALKVRSVLSRSQKRGPPVRKRSFKRLRPRGIGGQCTGAAENKNAGVGRWFPQISGSAKN